MSEKLYAEDLVRGAIKHFWPMGDDDGVNRYLATLLAASAPVVPSDPLYGVSCEHMGNGSARWSMSQQKENELRELLYPTPSPSDQVREAVKQIIELTQPRSGGPWTHDINQLAMQALAALSTGVTPHD